MESSSPQSNWRSQIGRIVKRQKTVRRRGVRRFRYLERLEERTVLSGMAGIVPDDFVIQSLSASSAAVPQGAALTLTAEGESGLGQQAQRVEFYVDADGDGQLDPEVDLLLAADLDGSDGWNVTISTAGLNAGTHQFFAIAWNESGEASNAATTSAEVITSIQWTGAGGDHAWHNAANWTSGSVPGLTDYAVIAIPDADFMVNIDANATIGSLYSEQGLSINNGTFSVHGTGVVYGNFRLGVGTTLIVSGEEAYFLANDTAQIDRVNLTASNGGVIRLTSAETILGGGSSSSTVRNFLRAMGTGSRIELPDVQTIVGGLFNASHAPINGVYFEATGGGRITLPALEETSRQVYFSASSTSSDAVPSRIELPALFAMRAGGFGGGLSVAGTGSIQVPVLTELETLDLRANSGADLTLPSAVSYVSGGSTSARVRNFVQATGPESRVDLPKLKTIVGGLLNVSHTPINGVYFEATGGGQITLPVLEATSRQVYFSASSTSNDAVPSRIELPALFAMRAGGFGGGLSVTGTGSIQVPVLTELETLDLKANSGAELNLPSAVSYVGGGSTSARVRNFVQATGKGSRVELPLLETLVGGLWNVSFAPTNGVFIEAMAGGKVDLPKLQWTSRQVFFTASTSDPDGNPSRIDLGALTEMLAGGFGGSLNVHGAGVIDAPATRILEATSLSATGGGWLGLPSVETHQWLGGNGVRPLIRADGVESRVELPNMTTLVEGQGWPPFAGSPNWTILRATNGGAVRMPSVTTLSQQTRLEVTGSASTLDLGAATSIHNTSIAVNSGGVLHFNQESNTQVMGSPLALASAGTLTGRVEIGAGSTLSGEGTITGHLLNSGTVRLISGTGVLTIQGDYTQGPVGRLEVQLSAADAAQAHDRMVVTGSATLDGQLVVSTVGGFQPSMEDELTVLSFGTRTCDFETKIGLELGNDLFLAARFGPENMTLVAGDVPDPGQQCQASPEFTEIRVGPHPAKAGDLLSITFDANFPLPSNPLVTVDGQAAGFTGQLGLLYTYGYLVTGQESEGSVEVEIVGESSTGEVGTALTLITLDFTAPMLSDLEITPSQVMRGDLVTIRFTASEPLSTATVVTIGGRAANLMAVNGLEYTYQRILNGQEGTGIVPIEVVAVDLAGNSGGELAQIQIAGGLSIDATGIAFSEDYPEVGQQVTATVNIRNSDQHSRDDVELLIRLYEPGGEIRILGTPTLTSVPGDAFQEVQITFDVQTPGVQLFEVTIDPHNLIAEDTKADNVAARALPAGVVDVALQVSASISHASVPPGGSFTVSGLATYPVSFRPATGSGVEITVPGSHATATAITDQNGEFFGVAMTAPEIPGNYLVRVRTSDGTIEGTSFVGIVVESPESGADLSVRAEQIGISPLPVVGESVFISTRVHNLGADDVSGPIDVNFYDGTEFLGTVTLVDLPSNSFKTASLPHVFAEADWRTIRVVVDPANRVTETRTDNNTASRAFDVLPAIPNLTATRILLSDGSPSSIQLVTITAEVHNRGGITANNVEVLFLDNGEVIGTVLIPKLPGRHAVAHVSVQTVLAPAGEHLLEIVVDPENVIAEANESNNSRSRLVYVHDPAPDLAPSSILVSPSLIVVDHPVNISTTIRNQGQRLAEGFDVHFQHNGEVIAMERITSLGINETKQLSITTAFSTTGQHSLRVIVDPANEVPERVESNNVSTLSVTVLDTLLPDLWLQAEQILLSDATPSPGQTVQIDIPVHNSGIGPAVAPEVQLLLNGEVVQTLTLETLAAGETRAATFSFVAPDNEGYHLLEIIADPQNLIGELAENNNRVFRLLLIGQLPDLIVSNIQFSNSHPIDGEVILISASVDNLGDQHAYGVLVSFYDGGELIGNVSGLDLVLGESTSRVVSVPYSTNGRAGMRSIHVVVDPKGVIPDKDPTNNSLTTELSISAAMNLPPIVVTPIADLSVNEGTPTITRDLTTTFDDGDIATRSDELSLSVVGNTRPDLVAIALQDMALAIDALDGPGSSLVTVRATDREGAYVEETFEVVVHNVAPTATFLSSGLATYGETVTVAFTNPLDPSTTDTSVGFRYAYALDPLDLDTITYAEGSSEVASWEFSGLNAGTHVIHGKIIDKDEGFSTYSTTLTIAKASLTVTADDTSIVYGDPDPSLSFTVSGPLYYGDTSSVVTGVVLTTVTGASVTAGTHPIMASGGEAENYMITHVDGTLTVAKADQGLLWDTPNSILAGTPLSEIQLNASVLVVGPSEAGELIYHPMIGTLLDVGIHTLSVTALETENYHKATRSVQLMVFKPYSISGLVYVDFNNDGEVNFGEVGIPDVLIQLTGTDDQGNQVTRDVWTDEDGFYKFSDLRPGTYHVAQTQPDGYLQGINSVGTLGGELVAIDQFFLELGAAVVDPEEETDGLNYNFGERPPSDGVFEPGQTAGIGFWQNKNGQALIKSLNGDPSSTQLGDWLAATMPNMFAGLEGKSNALVGSHFQSLFAIRGQKLEAQVMATALAVYVTNHSLAGHVAESFGFTVTTFGVGNRMYNVGTSGAAFGVEDHTEMSVIDLLLVTDSMTWNGVLYYSDSSSLMKSLRNMANRVYDDINN